MIVNKDSLSQAYGVLGILHRAYERHPEKTVIQVNNKKLIWKDLIEQGTRVACALYDMGIRKGDRVGIMTVNSTDWYVFLYATLRLGAVFVPFDPQLGQVEIKFFFDRAGVRTVLVSPSFRGLNHAAMISEIKDQLLDLKNIIVDGEYAEDDFVRTLDTLKNHPIKDIPDFHLDKEDSNLFICTTGSTGNPKVVDIPCRLINYTLERTAPYLGFKKNAKLYLTMPLYHAAGFGWGISCLSMDGTVYYSEKFMPTDVLNTIQNEKITMMLSTPTLMKILLTYKKLPQYDISSVEGIIFTGEYLPNELMCEFADKYKMRVINGLGMSETNVFLIWDSIKDREVPSNHFSRIPGIDIKITDDNGNIVKPGEKGTINIKNSVMKGYYRYPELTAKTISKDGWLNSGDLAMEDETGRIVFMGREKRVIKRGGNLVSSEEVEQFLKTYKTVAAVVIDKEEDEIMGERIAAYIQPAEGEKITSDELIAFCRGNISSYKIPDVFYFIKEVPNTSGKANQTKLRHLRETNQLEFID